MSLASNQNSQLLQLTLLFKEALEPNTSHVCRMAFFFMQKDKDSPDSVAKNKRLQEIADNLNTPAT